MTTKTALPKAIKTYIKSLNKIYKTGTYTEHSFRGALKDLMDAMINNNKIKNIDVINEPKSITDCGNPDYLITRNQIPIGFIEAKNIDQNLNHKKYTEQFTRYREGLDNLIITDYLEFQFFDSGKHESTIKIGKVVGNTIERISENVEIFENRIIEFCHFSAQPITHPKILAEMMAKKARLLKNIFERALSNDVKTDVNTELHQQYKGFKKLLIRDMSVPKFADIYAQTLAYGMFAARLHDESPDTFSRDEAAYLIPKSNPFLRNLFNRIAGFDIDKRIERTVDNLAELFRATQVDSLWQNFRQDLTKNTVNKPLTQDPIIYFYEYFLKEYDPELRKKLGVYYTPAPVVNFIVRGVDYLLKSEFGIKQGLACADQISREITNKVGGKSKQIHKVQLLDPATGTGTFLMEVVRHIKENNFKMQQGMWQSYVEKHLLPRLNGFEISMVSYAIAHLKLGALLRETGCDPDDEQRFRLFLTDSLEEFGADADALFAEWLSAEANAANAIKRGDSPVMVVLGNPPYLGASNNKGKWIMDLMDDYKKEPGGNKALDEKNKQWINNDYAKFLRYGEHFIEHNGEGIVAYITANSFLDSPTFRGMRWHLLNTYDQIYTLDLHGNSNKKETAPDGSKDENVFYIKDQGVSINFFIKTGKKQAGALAQIFHYDLYGKREDKYRFLLNNSLKTVKYKSIENKSPMYFMVPKDFEFEEEYNNGFSIKNLFTINGVGLTTAHDEFSIKNNKENLLKMYKEFQNTERDAGLLHSKFKVNKKKGWDILNGYDNIKNELDISKYIQPISCRPFDNRFVFYEDKLVWRTVRKVMQHFLKGENVGLIFPRVAMETGTPVFITKNIIDKRGGHAWAETISYLAPLYLYPEDNKKIKSLLDTEKLPNLAAWYPDEKQTASRVPNLNLDIIAALEKCLSLSCVPEKNNNENQPKKSSLNRKTFAPIDLLDYCYAVLHAPQYRAKYQAFLKIDFPRVPYPKTQQIFWKLVKYGGQLRQLHLLEADTITTPITEYPIAGNNKITHRITAKNWQIVDAKKQLGKVYINETQYFKKVPKSAWEFYIGGYQPAQKWLKDRQEKTLNYKEITHYQKIIVSLTETNKIMQQIGKIE